MPRMLWQLFSGLHRTGDKEKLLKRRRFCDASTQTDAEPIVTTESVLYSGGSDSEGGLTTTRQVPLVPTTSQTVVAGAAEGEIVSSQTISSKTRTVETVTYKTEKDGVVETWMEQKITIQSDRDPIDHDKALAEAIQEATAMNPDLTVEKIEIQQQSSRGAVPAEEGTATVAEEGAKEA